MSVYRAQTSPWSASEASVDFWSVMQPLTDAAGAPVSGWWEPPDVTRWVYWTNPRLIEPDLYVVGPALLLNSHVLRGDLAHLLHTTGELLPVRSVQGRSGEWFMYNCTTVFGAVDFERSTIRRFESSQRISGIRDPVYKSGIDAAAPAIFRQEQLERSGPLFSKRGRDIVVASGATGLEFDFPFERCGGRKALELGHGDRPSLGTICPKDRSLDAARRSSRFRSSDISHSTPIRRRPPPPPTRPDVFRLGSVSGRGGGEQGDRGRRAARGATGPARRPVGAGAAASARRGSCRATRTRRPT